MKTTNTFVPNDYIENSLYAYSNGDADDYSNPNILDRPDESDYKFHPNNLLANSQATDLLNTQNKMKWIMYNKISPHYTSKKHPGVGVGLSSITKYASDYVKNLLDKKGTILNQEAIDRIVPNLVNLGYTKLQAENLISIVSDAQRRKISLSRYKSDNYNFDNSQDEYHKKVLLNNDNSFDIHSYFNEFHCMY